MADDRNQLGRSSVLSTDRRTLLLLGGAAIATGASPIWAKGGMATALIDSAAQWIGRNLPPQPAAPGNQAPAPLLRRAFDLPAVTRSARLIIVGYGYYHAEINGRAVSDAVLDPPPSQYDHTTFSREIDVTALLASGRNAIGVSLGRSYVSGIAGPGTPWIAEPRLLAQLDVTLADGSTRRIVTDGAWKLADSPITDWMYFGEHYDARLEQPGWSSAEFDDSAWASAPVQPAPTRAIVSATVPAVVVTDTWAPVHSTSLSPATTVYDFGRMTAGWGRIAVRGTAGTRLEIAYGQQLNADGTVALALPWGTKDPALRQHVDFYTLKGGGDETWEPKFTRHGFQFAQVTVLEGTLEHSVIEARECHTPVASTGTFECASPLVNRLHENHRRSLLLNHWGFPTDTSHRDRQGWTADTHCYMDSALLNFADLEHLYHDWLRTLRDCQQADGGLPAFAPQTFGFPAMNDPSWGGMIVLIPWKLYHYTGKLSYLSDSYPAMARWMDLMDQTIAGTGNLYNGFSFGDHGPPGAENSGTMDIRNIEGPDVTRNAHLYHEARVLARIARQLRKGAAARRYDAMAERILLAFNAAYFHAADNEYRTPTQTGYRQTSNLLPLAFDMVPDGHRDAVFAKLVADIEGRGTHLNTGAIGTKLILPVLTRFGRADLAYALLTQTEYPSWGYWVKQGATTSWEVWRVKGVDQTMDHPFLGTFDEWLYQGLGGIEAATPGYDTIRLAPLFPADLGHLAAAVETPRGAVSVAWRREGGKVLLDIALPAGKPTRLVLPFAARRVTALAGQVHLDEAAAGQATYTTKSRVLKLELAPA